MRWLAGVPAVRGALAVAIFTIPMLLSSCAATTVDRWTNVPELSVSMGERWRFQDGKFAVSGILRRPAAGGVELSMRVVSSNRDLPPPNYEEIEFVCSGQRGINQGNYRSGPVQLTLGPGWTTTEIVFLAEVLGHVDRAYLRLGNVRRVLIVLND